MDPDPSLPGMPRSSVRAEKPRKPTQVRLGWGLRAGHPPTHLVLEHKDEDVVCPHSQHQERHHLKDHQGGRDSQVGEEAHGGHDGSQHHGHPAQAQRDFGVHLQRDGVSLLRQSR